MMGKNLTRESMRLLSIFFLCVFLILAYARAMDAYNIKIDSIYEIKSEHRASYASSRAGEPMGPCRLAVGGIVKVEGLMNGAETKRALLRYSPSYQSIDKECVGGLLVVTHEELKKIYREGR